MNQARLRLLCCFAASLSISVVPAHAEQGATAEAAIVFNGEISQSSVDDLERQLQSAPASTLLMLTSPGGDIEAGIRFGRLVRASKLNVYVDRLCASSCANYVFPAGRLKLLGPGAVVGWHGGAASRVFNNLDLSSLNSSSPEYKLLLKLRKKEASFFKSIGVKPELVCAGDYISPERVIGWTMPRSAMRRFGISDVIDIGGDIIPTSVDGRKEKIVVLDARPQCTRAQRELGASAY